MNDVGREKLRAGGGRRRERKRKLTALIVGRDYDAVADVVADDESAIQVLFSLLYEKDSTVRWRAIEAVGVVAARTAETRVETVRDWVRRQIWAMNEESGNMAWFAPETISEICLAVPGLLREYGRILVSNLEEPVFRRGCFLAMARLAVVDAEPFADLDDEIVAGLTDPHPEIRATSAITLGALKRTEALAVTDEADPGAVELYERATGRVVQATVGRCVRAAKGGGDLRKLMDGEFTE